MWICGCVNGVLPKAGSGSRRDAMTGCWDTGLISCRASNAETDPPTTTTFYVM